MGAGSLTGDHCQFTNLDIHVLSEVPWSIPPPWIFSVENMLAHHIHGSKQQSQEGMVREHVRGPGGRIAERLLELWKAATAAGRASRLREANAGATAARDASAGRMNEAIVMVV